MHEPLPTHTRSLLRDQPVKSRHWLAWLLVLVVCGVLLLPLLHKAPAAATQTGGGRGGRGGAGPGGETAVTVAQVRTGEMQIFLDAMGTVTPQATVNVYSQVSGRVESVNYREGQMVQKGQVLVEIDPRPTEAQLQQAQAALSRDQATLQQARTDLQRYQEALEDHAIAEQTVSDQKATVAQDEGTVANDTASVNYYQVQLGYCHIVAPITGRIGLRLIDAGNTIFSGSGTTIATIAQVDPITVVFAIAEDNLPQVRQQYGSGKPLDVDLYDRELTTKIASGHLLSLDNQVDTTTGTVKLRALFNNPKGALFANEFVNTRLQVNTLQNAKLIPTVAVQYNGQQAFVYQVQQDKTAHLHNITVVNSEGDQSAIDGLNPGDTIVTSNFDRLEDGATVSIAQPGRGAQPAGQSNPPGGTSQKPAPKGQGGGRSGTAGPGR